MNRSPLTAVVLVLVVAAGVTQFDDPVKRQPAVPTAEPAPKIEPAPPPPKDARPVLAPLPQKPLEDSQKFSVRPQDDDRISANQDFGPTGSHRGAGTNVIRQGPPEGPNILFPMIIPEPKSPTINAFGGSSTMTITDEDPPPVVSTKKSVPDGYPDGESGKKKDMTGVQAKDGGNQSAKTTGSSGTTSGFTINGGSTRTHNPFLDTLPDGTKNRNTDPPVIGADINAIPGAGPQFPPAVPKTEVQQPRLELPQITVSRDDATVRPAPPLSWYHSEKVFYGVMGLIAGVILGVVGSFLYRVWRA